MQGPQKTERGESYLTCLTQQERALRRRVEETAMVMKPPVGLQNDVLVVRQRNGKGLRCLGLWVLGLRVFRCSTFAVKIGEQTDIANIAFAI